MITRHGRSDSTVSSVLPNSVLPPRGGIGMTIACARISFASCTITTAGLPRARLLPVAGHAAPASQLCLLDHRLRR